MAGWRGGRSYIGPRRPVPARIGQHQSESASTLPFINPAQPAAPDRAPARGLMFHGKQARCFTRNKS